MNLKKYIFLNTAFYIVVGIGEKDEGYHFQIVCLFSLLKSCLIQLKDCITAKDWTPLLSLILLLFKTLRGVCFSHRDCATLPI